MDISKPVNGYFKRKYTFNVISLLLVHLQINLTIIFISNSPVVFLFHRLDSKM